MKDHSIFITKYKRNYTIRFRVNLLEFKKIKYLSFTNGFENMSSFIRFVLFNKVRVEW